MLEEEKVEQVGQQKMSDKVKCLEDKCGECTEVPKRLRPERKMVGRHKTEIADNHDYHKAVAQQKH